MADCRMANPGPSLSHWEAILQMPPKALNAGLGDLSANWH
jgi:hypothetical protein